MCNSFFVACRFVYLNHLVALNHLNGSTGNEEPLVNAGVNRSRSLVVTLRDVELAGVGAVVGVRDSGVGEVNVTLVGLASDELLPGLGALSDDVHGVLLVLALAAEGELVLGLAIGDLVDAEPLVGGTEKTRQVSLDILDVVELGGERVVDVNDDDLPVSLALVEQSHDTEDLDLLDLTRLGDELTNLADVERVVVTLSLGLGVGDVGVLPGLEKASAELQWVNWMHSGTYLGEGTVVPEVTLVGEAVADEAQLALLGVLLDGVEGLLLGDLMACQHACARHWEEGLRRTSCLALVQRGISTTMFRMVCCSLA